MCNQPIGIHVLGIFCCGPLVQGQMAVAKLVPISRLLSRLTIGQTRMAKLKSAYI